MKARIKETDEIVNVIDLFDDGTAKIGSNEFVKISTLDIIDPEQLIRYEIAKEALNGIIAHNPRMIAGNAINENVCLALQYADEFIKQWK